MDKAQKSFISWVTDMKKGESLSSIGLLLLAGFLIQEAITMPLGKVSNPGAGLIPVCLGALLGLLSLILFIRSYRNREPAQEKESKNIGESNWKLPFFIIISLVGYAFIFEKVGFFLSTFLLITAITYIFKPRRVFSMIAFSLLASGGAYLLFSVLLKVTLP